MSAEFTTEQSPTYNRQRWYWLVAVLVVVAAGLLATLHMYQKQRLLDATNIIRDLGYAGEKLSEGLLHLSLSVTPNSPWQREWGIALLYQSFEAYEQIIGDAEEHSVPRIDIYRYFGRELEAMDQELSALKADIQISTRLMKTLDTDPAGPHAQDLSLVIYRMTGRIVKIDRVLRAALVRELARQDRIFYGVMLVAVLLFILIWVLLWFVLSTTERKNLEERLRQRDSLLSIATRVARLGGYSLDLERSRVTISDDVCALFEVPSQTSLTLEALLSFFPDPWRSALAHVIERCIKLGEPWDEEMQVVSRDGNRVWVRTLGHAVRDDSGNIVRIVGALQDMTEQKQISTLLAQGNQRFRQFADAMPLLVWAAEPNGTIDYANKALLDYTGRSGETLIEADGWMVSMHPEDIEHCNIAWENARAHGSTLLVEFRLRRFDGSYRWHMARSVPVRAEGNGIIKWYGSAIDIHDRKQSEQQARHLAERLADTLESITDAFITVDRKWSFTYVNAEAEKLLQCERSELLGRTLWEAFPEVVGTEFERNYRLARSESRKVSFEAFFSPLNAWFSVNAYPSQEGLSIYFQNVTERKRLDEERARIDELESARQVAELASQTKSTFLASMSHEIRTPINGVIGMVEVLHQTSLKGYQVEMVDIIHESALSLLGIIDDILDFSKIEAGRLQLDTTPLSPLALMRSVGLMLDRLAESKAVELLMYVDPALPPLVKGDELRIRQILINLVNNAIKFSSNTDGGGKVLLRAHLLEQRADEVLMEFRIKDNGIGMPEETLSRLFSPFTQADVSTTRHYGGTGLGLTITRNLVDLMNGDIKVASEVGSGSEFRVRLTLALCAPESQPIPAAPDLDGLSCVLLGHGFLDDLADYLRAAGAQVTCLAGTDVKVDHLTPPRNGLWLWICDGGKDGDACQDLWQIAPPNLAPQVRWLVLSRGQRRKPRLDGDGVVRVDANVLDPITFLKAAAIAAERQVEDEAAVPAARNESAFLPPPREQAQREGKLILVAEDNETNRKVIARQLALLGYAVDMTANGREALARWREGNYALLLTDLHMPEMDGYQLAETIRSEETGKCLPIIALTANALSGEAERCRALGMNDYLTKPAALASLQQALEHWLEGAGREQLATRDKAAANGGNEPVNVAVLQGIVGEDAEVVREFLASFRHNLGGLSESVVLAGDTGDLASLGQAAHSLKSSARAVGALGLGDICATLEVSARAGRTDDISEPLQQFVAEVALVKAWLEHFLNEPDTPPVDPDQPD